MKGNRKPGRPRKLDRWEHALVERRLLQGESLRHLAAEFGVGKSTIARVMPELANQRHEVWEAARRLAEAEEKLASMSRQDRAQVLAYVDAMKARGTR